MVKVSAFENFGQGSIPLGDLIILLGFLIFDQIISVPDWNSQPPKYFSPRLTPCTCTLYMSINHNLSLFMYLVTCTCQSIKTCHLLLREPKNSHTPWVPPPFAMREPKSSPLPFVSLCHAAFPHHYLYLYKVQVQGIFGVGGGNLPHLLVSPLTRRHFPAQVRGN